MKWRQVETSGDSRFSVFLGSKSKFTGKNIDFSIEILLDPRVNLLLEPRKTEKRLSQPVSTSRSRCGSIIYYYCKIFCYYAWIIKFLKLSPYIFNFFSKHFMKLVFTFRSILIAILQTFKFSISTFSNHIQIKMEEVEFDLNNIFGLC